MFGDPPAKLVLVVMASSASGDGSAFGWSGRLVDLAARSDMTVGELLRCLADLSALGLIRRIEVGDGYEAWALLPRLADDEGDAYDTWTPPDPPGATRQRRYSAAKIAPAKRRYVYDRDSYMCRRCGTLDDLSIDHIIPRSRGGGNEVENLQTLCRSCNSSKGAKCHG